MDGWMDFKQLCDKIVWPDQFWIFGADADIREQENSDIQYIGRCYIILAECGYQILRQRYVMQAGYLTF